MDLKKLLEDVKNNNLKIEDALEKYDVKVNM